MRRTLALSPDSATLLRQSLSRFFISCLLLLPLWQAPALAAAADKISPPSGVASRFDKGLLWKIESPGSPASYLFGTIHSDDKRVLSLPEPVLSSLDASSHFVMEAMIDGDALLHMAKFMFYSDDRTLEQVIGKPLYSETLRALSARGIPTAGIEKQKPWAVMMVLSMPTPRTGEYLDLLLQARAVRMNLPVSGLETVSEQLQVFDSLSVADQVALLKDTVRTQDRLTRQFEELHKAWLDRDLAGIMTLAEKYRPANDRLYRDVMDRLLTQRNLRMADRLIPTLRKGGAFIAIGAAHLPGETGVLTRLEQAGYRVSSVY